MRAPATRGPVSTELLAALGRNDFPDHLPTLESAADAALRATEDILYDDDLQLALLCLYELHYSGIEGVDDRWEWHPALMTVRSRIEAAFEDRLRTGVERNGLEFGGDVSSDRTPSSPQGVAEARSGWPRAGTGPPCPTSWPGRPPWTRPASSWPTGPSTSSRRPTRTPGRSPGCPAGQVRAWWKSRPTSTAAAGPDGCTRSFSPGPCGALGLDPAFGPTWTVPAITSPRSTPCRLFGLQRRLRGAIVGHLAIYEMTSSIPNAYARGFRRLGFDAVTDSSTSMWRPTRSTSRSPAGTWPAAGRADPALAPDVFFGAAAVLRSTTSRGAAVAPGARAAPRCARRCPGP